MTENVYHPLHQGTLKGKVLKDSEDTFNLVLVDPSVKEMRKQIKSILVYYIIIVINTDTETIDASVLKILVNGKGNILISEMKIR